MNKTTLRHRTEIFSQNLLLQNQSNKHNHLVNSKYHHSTRCKPKRYHYYHSLFYTVLYVYPLFLISKVSSKYYNNNLIFQKSSNLIVSYNFTDNKNIKYSNNVPTPFNISSSSSSSSSSTSSSASLQIPHSSFQYETQVHRIRYGDRLKNVNLETSSFYGQNSKNSMIFLTTADEIRIVTPTATKQFFHWPGDISAKNTCEMIHGKNVSDKTCHNFVQIFAIGATESNSKTVSNIYMHMCGTNYQLQVCSIFEAKLSNTFELISSKLLAQTKETPDNYDNVDQKLAKIKRNQNMETSEFLKKSFSVAIGPTMIVAKNQRLLKFQYYPNTENYKITVGKLFDSQFSDSVFDSKILDLFLSQSKKRVYMVSNEHGFAKIAHVCVNDRGGIGSSEFRKTWASFMKTRMVCPGTKSELKKVEITNGKIYGLFGNKLCEFDLNSIESQFKSAKFSKIGSSKGSISGYLVKILNDCDFDELYSRMTNSKRKRLINEFKRSTENSELLEPVIGSIVYEFENGGGKNTSLNFGEILKISSVERSSVYDELFVTTTTNVFKLVMPKIKTENSTKSYLVEKFQDKTCKGKKVSQVLSTGDQIFGFNSKCIIELPHSVFACKHFSSSENCCNLSRNPGCYWTGSKCVGNAVINQNLNFTEINFDQFSEVCPEVSSLLEKLNPQVYPLFPKVDRDDSFVGLVASFWESGTGKITTLCIIMVIIMIFVIIYCGIRLKTTQKAGEELFDQAQEALKFIPMNEDMTLVRHQDSLIKQKVGRNNSVASDFNYSRNYVRQESSAEGFTPNLIDNGFIYDLNIQTNPQFELPATPSDQQYLAFQNLQKTLEKTEKKFSSLPRSKSFNMKKQQSLAGTQNGVNGVSGRDVYNQVNNGLVYTPQYEGVNLTKPVGHRGTIGKYRE